MKKRMLALLLTLAMLVTLVAACGTDSDNGGTTTTTTAGGNGGDDDGTDAPPSGDKVQLTALVPTHGLTQSVYDMEWLMDLQEQKGVEVEWEQIYSDWGTTKSTRFASGDIPDFMIAATANEDYITYAGLFMELSELIDEHAVNIKEMFAEEPDTRVLAETIDGEIFGIPKFQGKWPYTNTVMFINQEWLDNLDLEMPTTFSEFKDVLIAFRDNDANGNGDANDEVPFDFIGWFGSAYSLVTMIGSMGIQITNWGHNGYFAEDYEVKNYAVDERYKMLMQYLADLYAEDLINKDAITHEYSAFQSLSRGSEAGDAIVGSTFGWEQTDKFGPVLHTQYTALPPMDYDIGVPAGTYDNRWTHDFAGLNMDGNRVAISANASDPEAVIKFVDGFYDREVSVQVLFGGILDGNVSADGGDTYTVLPPQDPDTDPGTWKWTSSFADLGPMYIRRATTINMAEDMEYALASREVYQEALDKISDSDYYPQFFMKYTNDELNTMAVAQANINNITENFWGLWLTGESDIEQDWDNYVESVYAAGLQDVLDIRQRAFDVYTGN